MGRIPQYICELNSAYTFLSTAPTYIVELGWYIVQLRSYIVEVSFQNLMKSWSNYAIAMYLVAHHLLRTVSKKVFWGATRPRRGIFPIFPPHRVGFFSLTRPTCCQCHLKICLRLTASSMTTSDIGLAEIATTSSSCYSQVEGTPITLVSLQETFLAFFSSQWLAENVLPLISALTLGSFALDKILF